jgi:hypothetical protein
MCLLSSHAAERHRQAELQRADGNLWYTEFAGNKIARVNMRRYSLCLLYDPAKAVQSGATVPIRLQLCDGNGNNLSSSTLTLNAINVTRLSDSISGTVQDSGNANPDSNFRFAPAGGTGGYIFNLNTAGMTTGTYILHLAVTGDSAVYKTLFQVK